MPPPPAAFVSSTAFPQSSCRAACGGSRAPARARRNGFGQVRRLPAERVAVFARARTAQRSQLVRTAQARLRAGRLAADAAASHGAFGALRAQEDPAARRRAAL